MMLLESLLLLPPLLLLLLLRRQEQQMTVSGPWFGQPSPQRQLKTADQLGKTAKEETHDPPAHTTTASAHPSAPSGGWPAAPLRLCPAQTAVPCLTLCHQESRVTHPYSRSASAPVCASIHFRAAAVLSKLMILTCSYVAFRRRLGQDLRTLRRGRATSGTSSTITSASPFQSKPDYRCCCCCSAARATYDNGCRR